MLDIITKLLPTGVFHQSARDKKANHMQKFYCRLRFDRIEKKANNMVGSYSKMKMRNIEH